MRKLLTTLSTIISMMLCIQPALAADAIPDPEGVTANWTLRVKPQGWILGGLESPAVMTLYTNNQASYLGTCESVSTAPCSTKVRKNIFASGAMPVCASASQDFCIEEVRIYKKGEDPRAGQLIRSLGGNTVAADTKNGIPYLATSSLWEPTGETYPGIDGFMVRISSGFNWIFGGTKARVSGTQATIVPYVERDVPFSTPIRFEKADDGNWGFNRGSNSCRNDVWTDYGKCGTQVPFPKDIVVGVTVRAPKTFSGWIRGRLGDPQISSKIGSKFNTFSVDASAMEVPTFSTSLSWAETKPALKKIFAPIASDSPPGMPVHQFNYSLTENHEMSLSSLAAVAEQAGDTATGTTTAWNFSDAQSDRIGDLFSICNAKNGGFAGVVVTNSLMYDGKPPSFDGASLNYNVGGFHFEPDGTTPFEGYYKMSMRSDIARCLYGLSKAPVGGSVTVYNSKGVKKKATTAVGESNGWVNMTAAGFTFSKNKIKVKLKKK